jgi:colanic acid biosynthesis protein WcaH
MTLDLQTFATIVKHAPLAAIDLIVRRADGRVLLGLRSNKPAQGTWFVPGGRIMKDERFSGAFQRLARQELGVELSFQQARFLGVYEHFYTDNYSEAGDFGTHYVTLAYELDKPEAMDDLPLDQHHAFRWWAVDELLNSEEVHPNTKAYFNAG